MVSVSVTGHESIYDRVKELKEFDETKAGVKGLLDNGFVEVPKIFLQPPDEFKEMSDSDRTHLQIPIIDLHHGATKDDQVHKEIVDAIRSSSEKWGFFQVVNHGIATSVFEEMIKAVRNFNEQEYEEKKKYYSRDNRNRRVLFRTANWRDTLSLSMSTPDPIDQQELPEICRDIAMEYTKHVMRLGDYLLELLSEALGLEPGHLKTMGCADSGVQINHYNPACPQPELTLGIANHTDPNFLTILLQDDLGGLQVLYQDKWVDIHPTPGALVVNIADLLQIVSNDKFKSPRHRVRSNHIGPRISIAFFLNARLDEVPVRFGSIKQFISNNPAVYKEFLFMDCVACFESLGLDVKSRLNALML